jgi:ADP-heptose:LPS heptosyltransferase
MAVTRGRVLVLRALGLGDFCTAVPALRAIAGAFPAHEVLLAAPLWQAPLAAQCGIDAVVDASGLATLPPQLRGVDVAINLHGCGPESTLRLLELEPDRLIAFYHPRLPATFGGPPWRDEEHEVGRWCRLLGAAGIAADPGDIGLQAPGPCAPLRDTTVVIHPGAAALARRWPAERFADIAQRLSDAGTPVVLTGGREERALCEAIADDVGRQAHGVSTAPVASLAGLTDLAQLSHVVATAAGVISNDTGVAHLAAALGTPSVVLFGPTSPARWGPPQSDRHTALWKGGTGDPHGSTVDPGLVRISVAEVLDAVRSTFDVAVRDGP